VATARRLPSRCGLINPTVSKIDRLMTGARCTEKPYLFREGGITGKVPSNWPSARPEFPTSDGNTREPRNGLPGPRITEYYAAHLRTYATVGQDLTGRNGALLYPHGLLRKGARARHVSPGPQSGVQDHGGNVPKLPGPRHIFRPMFTPQSDGLAPPIRVATGRISQRIVVRGFVDQLRSIAICRNEPSPYRRSSTSTKTSASIAMHALRSAL
jgi:hypothetical protein